MTAHAIPPEAGVPDDVRARIRADLDEASAHRRRQLDALLTDGPGAGVDVDPVASAQRATVRHLLQQVLAAQAHLDDDDFGRCSVCQGPIPVARLEVRPWTTTCVACPAP
ncbi:TraR/DksA family transcriptional regulator [Nocardioides nanhaiensis]|uniref:Zinc finger DksA/TraR C4-type domain-containing protein n=1 Tax=Nocardioides nanhaiensis TaxID=1476871 RepID=A0ABP8WCV2_9ACTN